MKNLIAVLTLFFATTIGAYAQEDASVLAKKELYSLIQVIELDNTTAVAINSLLVYKHETVAKSPENKKVVAQTIEDKLKGALTEEQFAKVKSNKALFEDLLY